MSAGVLLVRVTNNSGAKAPRNSKLRTALRAAAALARRAPPAGSRHLVDVSWVSDAEMRRLNRRHTGRTGTTDVLSFEDGSPDPELRAARLGDVICNLELAASRAQELGDCAEAEAVLYAVHGLLHLVGFTDETPTARRRMRRAEVSALAEAGLRVKGEEWEQASRSPTRRRRRVGATVGNTSCNPSR